MARNVDLTSTDYWVGWFTKGLMADNRPFSSLINDMLKTVNTDAYAKGKAKYVESVVTACEAFKSQKPRYDWTDEDILTEVVLDRVANWVKELK